MFTENILWYFVPGIILSALLACFILSWQQPYETATIIMPIL